MHVLECQKLAQDIGYDSATFDLVGPIGSTHCKWLDAYFGFFQIVGKESEGFLSVNDLLNAKVHCENLKAPE